MYRKGHQEYYFYDLTWYLNTLVEWVPTEPCVTCAGCDVVDHLAPSIYATGAWARVYTLEIRTCSVSRTVRVRNTLWPAGCVGVSKVSRDARTASPTSNTSAISVCSTRTWFAGIYRRRFHRLDQLGDLVTLSEWVSIVTLWTFADCQMVPDSAFGIETTSSGAGVNATLL